MLEIGKGHIIEKKRKKTPFFLAKSIKKFSL